MNLSNLKDRMQEDFQSIDDLQQIYEELEASYQQLLAMSDQLTQAENKYASLIQNMRDIVWVADPHGEILYINNTVTDILGYQMEEMVGRKLYEFMCPLHEYKTGFCRDVVAQMNDVEFIRQEMWMLHKDGNTRKVLEVNSNHLIFEGELIEIQGVGRDITDRIQSERKITQKNRQLSFINDISTSITSNLSLNNLDQLLTETCKSIVTTVGVPLCTIRIKDEEGLLNLKAVSGKYKDLIKVHPIDAFEGKLSDVMLKREPVIFSSEESIDHPSRVSDVFE
ncbi:MAG TPA: PAS domain-containing protein, partial [Fusibacter sp.]|nr:PAS domain-containing protein [Fusibacter sp.]